MARKKFNNMKKREIPTSISTNSKFSSTGFKEITTNKIVMINNNFD